MAGGVDRPVATGRPRNLARRRVILRAALAGFARHGYQGATMRQVAEASGIGESLLYRYYASKRALLAGVVEEVVAEMQGLRRDLGAAAAGPAALREYLAEAGDLLLSAFERVSDWFAMRFTGLPLEPEELAGLHGAYDGIMDALAAGVRRRAACRDASVVARTLLGTLFSFHLFRMRAGHEPDSPALRETFLREVVELLLDAVEGYAGKAVR